MSVGSHIARRPEPLELGAQPDEMRLGGVCDMNVRKREPGMETCHHVCNRKGTGNDSAVGGGEQTQHQGPRQTDTLGAGKATIPPTATGLVYQRVMGVNENVDVG